MHERRPSSPAIRFLAPLLVWLSAATAMAQVPVLPFDEIRTGMTGTGRTVFSGTTIETFEVEIIGKLSNTGPDRNLILGRVSGGPLARTGVMSGMSGSPVYIDGKLIGAVAYSWGFSKEPIAGITPIAEMLDVASLEQEGRRAGGLGLSPADFSRVTRPASWNGFFAAQARRLAQPVAGAYPLSVPLTVSGLGPRGFASLLPELADAGFLPLQGGNPGDSPEPSPPLEPGSAMGVKLMRGDIDMTVTGTVTWVGDNGILGFGHPMFGMGNVDLPLTGARVETLMPSVYQSARLATPLSEVGALRQDRTAAVYGRLGTRPRMLPVRVQFSGATRSRTYSFDMADDAMLSPLLLYSALQGIINSEERLVGEASLRLREGSTIKMDGIEDVRLDNLFSGPEAFNFATGLPAYVLFLLMNNDWEPPRIAGINLLFEYDDEPRSGRVQRVTLDRYRARPGETVGVTVLADPFRGPAQALRREITIPPDTPPGILTLHVGGAYAIGRAEAGEAPVLPSSLDQFVRLINSLRRNDRIYISLHSEDRGILLGGTRLPNLPPSVTAILTRPKTRGNVTVVSRRGVLEDQIPTEYAVGGLARIQLQIEEAP